MVFEGHRPWLEAGKPVGGDEVQLFMDQGVDQLRDIFGWIGAIRVQRDDDVPYGILETGLVGPTVAPSWLLDHPGSFFLTDLPGAVLRVRVHDKHLVVYPGLFQC